MCPSQVVARLVGLGLVGNGFITPLVSANERRRKRNRKDKKESSRSNKISRRREGEREREREERGEREREITDCRGEAMIFALSAWLSFIFIFMNFFFFFFFFFFLSFFLVLFCVGPCLFVMASPPPSSSSSPSSFLFFLFLFLQTSQPANVFDATAAVLYAWSCDVPPLSDAVVCLTPVCCGQLQRTKISKKRFIFFKK